ncbi:MAG TPA: hypothetical protein VNZ06_03655, partial [Steroidobacteraceae bacterium]|nr:hypothetical protein [Steroidobacteraceae bacterium]
LLRASIPVGFMPGAGGQLMLCHDGMHVPNAPHAHYEHCPFGGGPASCPYELRSVVAHVTLIEQQASARGAPVLISIRLVHLPQPRGPPALV